MGSGEYVYVMETDTSVDGWYYVAYPKNGDIHYGYCSAKYLSPTEPTSGDSSGDSSSGSSDSYPIPENVTSMQPGVDKLVEIAVSQVGYEETYYDITKYGDAYTGSKNKKIEWCAIFAWWCAKQAGLPIPSCTNYASTNTFKMAYYDVGKLGTASGGYTPQPGDTVFYQWYADGDQGHTGVVIGCKDSYVYTFEGNTSPSKGLPDYGLDNWVLYHKWNISQLRSTTSGATISFGKNGGASVNHTPSTNNDDTSSWVDKNPTHQVVDEPEGEGTTDDTGGGMSPAITLNGWLRLYSSPTSSKVGRDVNMPNVPAFTGSDGYSYSFTDKNYWWAYENPYTSSSNYINPYAYKRIQSLTGKAPVVNRGSGGEYTDENGNYWMAVGPNVVNQNHQSNADITDEEMYGNGKLDVVVKNSSGVTYYIPAVVGDAKAHTWSNGIIQTFKSYPGGDLTSAGSNFDGFVCAEFIGDLDHQFTGFSDYSIDKIIFYAN